MRKQKALSFLLILAMVVSILPLQWSVVKAATAHNFNFNNEQYTVGAARITTNDRVTLTGTINNVDPASIKYSVYQINPSTGAVISSNENQTANITAVGTTLTVYNVQLFPGMNKITFTGTQGASTSEDSIFIEYRNSPMLYDLTAGIDGSIFNIKEAGSTVVYSSASMGKSSSDISISGKAPNATKVQVITNGKSNTYSVNSQSNFSFVASPINVKKGMNEITIRVYNNTQYVETTRNIAFYNGDVTFYDLTLVAEKDLNADGDVADPGESFTTPLQPTTNFSIPTGFTVKVTGSSIVPIVYNSVTKNFQPNTGWTWNTSTSVYDFDPLNVLNGNPISVTNDGSSNSVIAVNNAPAAPAPADKFFTVAFSYTLGSSSTTTGAGLLKFDDNHSIKFTGWNQAKSPAGTDDSDTFFYKLRNSTLAYIQDVNFIPGYNNKTTPAEIPTLDTSDLENTSLFSLPAGIELLIGNYQSGWVGAAPNDLVQLANIRTVTGNTTDGDLNGNSASTHDYSYKVLPNSSIKMVNINGVDTPFLRVFVTLNKLPSSGSMDLRFKLNNTAYSGTVTGDPYKDIPITMMYGPYVKYDGVFDGMQIKYDTTMSSIAGIAALIQTEFKSFKGQLFNVPNLSDIVFKTDTTSSPPKYQTAYLYINNTEVQLKVDTTQDTFVLADAAQETAAYNALNKLGDNNIKFVFRTKSNNYESNIKVTIVPTNLPVIPAPKTAGVFPYSTGLSAPLPNDPNFPLKGTVFSTKQAEMNIYGTFDFIDLGTTSGNAIAKLTAMQSGRDQDNYIMVISSPGDLDITWNMGKNLFTASDGAVITDEPTDTAPLGNLRVVYDLESQTFSFILPNQKLPYDGSSKVYSITVYNGGLNGPRATYRLEVDPTSIPYTIISPRTEKRILNQSYVEVILTSPGADSVTINKIPATKITYLDYRTSTPTEVPAFRAFVQNLKPNKTNRIDLIIKNANDTIKDSFDVVYAPENIPGAQTLLTMKNSLKAFDGKLNLTFPSGTNLIRRDYNTPDNLKGQVYKDNNILMAIANPEDGVVDRHDFETVPANYDAQLSMGRILFTASFPTRYIKASPVYWIDAGQADNPITPDYDPVTNGFDPYPLEVIKGTAQKLYYTRGSDREVIPSKRGTLTLAYDPSLRQSAGTWVTVFRFDPFIQQWENIGGVVDDKKNTVKVPFDRFGYYVVGKVGYTFNDVSAHPYAREAIEAIYAKGVMNATDPSGAFGTDQYVTRGEFARMLVRALDLPLNYNGPKHFVDVPDTGNAINIDALWDYRYIETAARAGIVRGTLPRAFSPDNTISRQDATVMLAKALNLKLDTDPNKSRATLGKLFKDEPSIDFYAKPSVAAIAKKGFMSGSPVDVADPKKGLVFEPSSRLLRADAAIIMAKVMVDLKKLPKIYSK
ncbi:S-layer homology domain-containing protein [Cohnella pontilimi]|nr:S-layer homology domain-containing protein [Cohnella pontilimi]